MKFIVIEGLDGSGKSTQLELLQDFFNKNNLKYKFIHFPKYDSPVYGELISMFLRGDLGKLEEVNPYLVALLYAGDRNNFKNIIRQWIDNQYYVLADRYVYSNIAFQCAKIQNTLKQDKLKQWILKTEYGYFDIPKPDINLFLNVPLSVIENRLRKNREGNDREYLQGKNDIHEANIHFQQRVKEVYDKLLLTEKFFYSIACVKSEKLIEPEIIHQTIVKTLKNNKIL